MKFHYLVRAVIQKDDKILLVKEVGSHHSFLPGGYIEFAEPAKVALKRELLEEIGLEATVTDFIGAVEHTWPSGGKLNAEINLLFHAELPNDCDVRSKEPHLELFWAEKNNLGKDYLEPEPLRVFFAAKQTGAYWASTSFWMQSLEGFHSFLHREK